jgi:hypothetical protein
MAADMRTGANPAWHLRSRLAALAMAACVIASPAVAQPCRRPAVTPYAGPLFDAMSQTGQWLDGEAAVGTARSVGVTRMALFPRVHKREDGRSVVSALASAHRDFIVVGSPKLFDMRDDLDSAYVEDVVSGVAAGRYAFVGEILYAHGDKEGGEVTIGGERYIDPTRPRTARLVEGLKGRRAPIMTHWEVYDWRRDRPRFDQLYAAHAEQAFIWPHVGFGTARQTAEMLGAHANLRATLSKKENREANLADDEKAEDVGGPVVDACDVLLPEWRDILVRFSDRLMFATDAHKPDRWSHYAQIVTRWRTILAQLPSDVAFAIAYNNAAMLYGR